MKKLILLSVIFVLLLPGIVLAQNSGTSVGIDISKHDPAPAEAGKFLEVWIAVNKIGGNNLNNYVVEILPEFPFFLAAGSDASREFRVIDGNGAVANYKLRVADDAPDGDATLKVRHFIKGSTAVGTSEVKIPILSKIDLSIDSITPDTLIPGQPTTVSFVFENSGEAVVRDLIITWKDPNGGVLPLAGENRHRIDRLNVGAKERVDFKMIANPTITQGVHVVNVDMGFQRFGVADNRTSNIAFIVGGLTDFDVALDEIEEGTLSLSVANIGVNTATGVLLKVPEQDGWEIIGSSGVFLGNLESGDFTVASVDVVPLSNDLTQTLDVSVEYTDTVGIRQSSDRNIKINLANLLSSKEGSQQGPDATTIIGIIVVVVVVFWFVNRKFKIIGRKHQKK